MFSDEPLRRALEAKGSRVDGLVRLGVHIIGEPGFGLESSMILGHNGLELFEYSFAAFGCLGNMERFFLGYVCVHTRSNIGKSTSS